MWKRRTFISVPIKRNYTRRKLRKKKQSQDISKKKPFMNAKIVGGLLPFKSKCTTAKGNKKLSISKKFITYREKSLKNLKSDDGIILRVNRSIQVEGAFGVLKQNMGFKRFFSRGLKNVMIEFYLLAFAYNIQKFHQKNQNDRLGHHLHPLKNA